MKKMILGVAALAAATSFAAIESANVVGYQTKTVAGGGFNYLTPTFVPVEGGDIDIQSIKLGDTATEYLDNIQIWDNGGVTIAQYYWTSEGWIDENGEPIKNAKIKPGESFVVESMDDTTMTFAGAVSDKDVVVESVPGFTMMGNATPVDIDLQDVSMGEDATEYLDNIQIWDNGGVAIAQYYWTADGWIDEEGTVVTGITINAGQGFTVEAMTEETPIIIPSAL